MSKFKVIEDEPSRCERQPAMEENNSFVCAFNVVSKALLTTTSFLIEEEPETQHAYELKNSSCLYVYCISKSLQMTNSHCD